MSAHKTALLSALTTALLASASLQAAEPLKAVGAGEGQVNIVAWPGYIERGETDKAYDWVTKFREAETRAARSTSKPPLPLTKWWQLDGQRAAYDLVTASGDASLRLMVRRARPADQHRP
jgi:putative spermidine/putrescine transport system substrate-binding protein